MNTNRPVWVIDAGHGGEGDELGSSHNRAKADNGLLEKDLTLDIATRVGRLLSTVADVRLTRSTDVNLPLSARARIARDAGATLFVSLHMNGSHDPRLDGTEAWIARKSNSGSAALAQDLAARVAAVTGGPNRGVKQCNLGVLLPERHSPGTAACLLEIAFLTNPAQASRMMRSEYRDGIAAAIADALRHTAHSSTATAFVLDLGEGPPLLAKATDSCWKKCKQLLAAARKPGSINGQSAAQINRETGVKVDTDPYFGISQNEIEAVIRASFHSHQMPEVLLALWAKEGSTRSVTAPQELPQATTAANARSIFRSGVYYVDLGNDDFIDTTRPDPHGDNLFDDSDAAAPRNESVFIDRVRSLVRAGFLPKDISGAINGELTVTRNSSGNFTVMPSVRFYGLSLLLMDAYFTQLQENSFPQLSLIPTALNYLQWNMGQKRFGEFLTSADSHRREPAHQVKGQPISIEQWALHTKPKSTEWAQARRNAIRFLHFLESYKPIFADAITLIKPGIEDLQKISSNTASITLDDTHYKGTQPFREATEGVNRAAMEHATEWGESPGTKMTVDYDTAMNWPERYGARARAQSNGSTGKTLYLPIKLNQVIPPKVGVFIPAGFQTSPAVDIIVYFHGHIIPDCKTDASKFESKGIEYYWDTPLFACLREDLASSGRNAILIAPTFKPFFGGKVHPSSYSGDLDVDGKFDLLINECLKHLKKANQLPNDARPRNIVLAGHSAGGRPMQAILVAKNALKQNIVECWGFECLYFGTGGWAKWLGSNDKKKFIHYRRESKFQGVMDALKKHSNFQDIHDGKTHCDSVQQKWRAAIDGCPWLQSSNQKVAPGPAVVPKNKPFSAQTMGDSENGSARMFIEEDLLKGHPLSNQRIVVATKKGKKGSKAYVAIMESPSVFVPQILRLAAKIAGDQKKGEITAKLNPDRWFTHFTRSIALPDGKTGDLTFLGRKLNGGQYIHVELAKSLRQIEEQFVKELKASPKDAGDILLKKSDERMAGTRAISSTAKYSYHMFGLAVDINYLGNPFIQSSGIEAINNALKNAASLMNTEIITYEHGTNGKFKDRFDYVQAIDSLLEQYFGLLDNQTELERYRSNSSEWRTRSIEDAKTRVQKDLDWLSGALERRDTKDYKRKDYFKKHTILNFDKRFVLGMEQRGLYWGGHYGDMMHFDMRNTGVGAYIRQGIKQYQKNVDSLAESLFNKGNYGTYTSDGQSA
jgi:N-acetylmuramoyl-L-alanine amidase